MALLDDSIECIVKLGLCHRADEFTSSQCVVRILYALKQGEVKFEQLAKAAGHDEERDEIKQNIIGLARAAYAIESWNWGRYILKSRIDEESLSNLDLKNHLDWATDTYNDCEIQVSQEFDCDGKVGGSCCQKRWKAVIKLDSILNFDDPVLVEDVQTD